MKHTTNIDKQLGLVPMDDFSSADGRGLAKAALATGLTGCSAKHPFNKEKREACKKEKLQIYVAKISAIDGVTGETSKEAKQIAAITQVVNMAKPKPYSQERYSKPKVDAIVKDASETAAAAAADEIAASLTPEEEGMSKGTKIAIGVGALVVLVGGYMYMKKN